MTNSGQEYHGQLPPDSSSLERSNARFNFGMQEVDRDHTNQKAERLIGQTYFLIHDYLRADAQSYDIAGRMFAAGGTHASVMQYVVPSILSYPFDFDDAPRNSLSLLFEAKHNGALHDIQSEIDDEQNLDDTDDPMQRVYGSIFQDKESTYRMGDRLRLAVPINKKYKYPEPLTRDQMPPDVEPQMLVEYVPAGMNQSLRFLVRQDPLEEFRGSQANFQVVRYESGFDRGEQYIEGEGVLTDRMALEGLAKRLPSKSVIIHKLFEFATEFDIVPQTIITNKSKQEL